jgi:hypothetical protein
MPYDKTDERIAFLKCLNLDSNELKVWIKKWRSLRANSSTYCKCKLSFEQYVELATQAGISSAHQIGNHLGQLQMGRIGDKGDYEVGNCRFITKQQNLAEWVANGGKDQMIASRKLLTKENNSGVATMAVKMVDISSKNFRLIDPAGIVHCGRNLKQFCSSHNLNPSAMSLTLNGHRKHHKGWTGKFESD